MKKLKIFLIVFVVNLIASYFIILGFDNFSGELSLKTLIRAVIWTVITSVGIIYVLLKANKN